MQQTEDLKNNNQVIHIKAVLGNEIRRFSIDSPTFETLQKTIATTFNTQEELSIKYKDEEADLVTMTSTEELKTALFLKQEPLLRLYLFPTKNAENPRANAGSALRIAPLIQTTNKLQEKANNVQPKEAPSTTATPEHKNMYPPPFPFRRPRHFHRFQRAPVQNFPQDADPNFKRGRGWFQRKMARLVCDVTVPPKTRMEPGCSFVKTWKVRNEESEPWQEGAIRLVPFSQIPSTKPVCFGRGFPDDTLSMFPDNKEAHIIPVPPTPVGGDVDLSVEMVAPKDPGLYKSFWCLVDFNGNPFGQKLKVVIRVATENSSSNSKPRKRWAKKGQNSESPKETPALTEKKVKRGTGGRFLSNPKVRRALKDAGMKDPKSDPEQACMVLLSMASDLPVPKLTEKIETFLATKKQEEKKTQDYIDV